MSVRVDRADSFDPVAPRFQRVGRGVRVTIHEDDVFELFARAGSDGERCLEHLLASVRAEGLTLGTSSQGVEGDGSLDRAAARRLRAAGLAIGPDGHWSSVGIADAHPVLARIFAETPWVGIWGRALLTLPGATMGARLLYGRVYSRSVMLPKAVVAATQGASR